jgi:nicotinamide-nucleotide amidase
MADATELGSIATENGLRVAVAESLTSGTLASTVGAAEGAGSWFAGGVVAYATDVKERVLGLQPGTDPCSSECAVQLARGVRDLIGADIAAATTGVGGPDPDGGHPAGTVYVGWAAADAAGYILLELDGDPASVLAETTARAIGLLTALARGDLPD